MRFAAHYAPLPDNYFAAQSGGMIIEESPFKGAMRRWARGEINETEEQLSALWRRATTTLHLEDFMRRLSQEHVVLPKPDSDTDIVTTADEMLARGGLQKPLLEWLLDHVAFDERTHSFLSSRWVAAGRPPLAYYAPYANHCARVLLSLAIAVHHNALRWEPTHAVDAQYLYYLPFCEIFVSDDHVHRLLGPQLLDSRQTFLPHAELKAALKKLGALTSTGESAEAASAAGESGSLLDNLWWKHRGRAPPRYQRRMAATPSPRR